MNLFRKRKPEPEPEPEPELVPVGYRYIITPCCGPLMALDSDAGETGAPLYYRKSDQHLTVPPPEMHPVDGPADGGLSSRP